MLWHLGTLLTLERMPLWGLADSWREKTLIWDHAVQMKPTNPEYTPQPPPQWSSHTQCHCAPALITPGSGTRQLKIVLIPPDLLKFFKVANPKPLYPALPCLSHWNHSQGCCPCFPHFPVSWATLVFPHVALYDDPHFLFLGRCECKPLTSWQSFLCLHVLPWLIKTNPGHILQH